MSTFGVFVKKINDVINHENADSLEIVMVDGYQVIVRKGIYYKGEMVAYIPENSVLPEFVLKHIGLWDKDTNSGSSMMHGKNKNVVRAVKLRGIVSQGLVFPVTDDGTGDGYMTTGDGDGEFAIVREGDNVASILCITKYEPEIPPHMSGEVFNIGTDVMISFDIENIKSFPNIIEENEEVVFTEKIHGTATIIGVLPLRHAHPEAFGENKNIIIASKGLGSKGLVFKNNKNNEKNLYIRTTRDIVSALDKMIDHETLESGFFILGETFGPKVQDLAYTDKVEFRCFGIVTGLGRKIDFLQYDAMVTKCKELNINTVPVVYRGNYTHELMKEHTDGNTTMSKNHIREGIVVVPINERKDFTIPSSNGRVWLKSVSVKYLMRKNGTEYN